MQASQTSSHCEGEPHDDGDHDERNGDHDEKMVTMMRGMVTMMGRLVTMTMTIRGQMVMNMTMLTI